MTTTVRVSDRDIADITREAMVTAFVAIGEALKQYPESVSAPQAGQMLLDTRTQLVGALVEEMDKRLREGGLFDA